MTELVVGHVAGNAPATLDLYPDVFILSVHGNCRTQRPDARPVNVGYPTAVPCAGAQRRESAINRAASVIPL
jgi:hypothetical protein